MFNNLQDSVGCHRLPQCRTTGSRRVQDQVPAAFVGRSGRSLTGPAQARRRRRLTTPDHMRVLNGRHLSGHDQSSYQPKPGTHYLTGEGIHVVQQLDSR